MAKDGWGLFFLDKDGNINLKPKSRKAGYRVGLWCAVAVVKSVNESRLFPGAMIYLLIHKMRKASSKSKGHEGLYWGFMVGMTDALRLSSNVTLLALYHSWDQVKLWVYEARDVSLGHKPCRDGTMGS